MNYSQNSYLRTYPYSAEEHLPSFCNYLEEFKPWLFLLFEKYSTCKHFNNAIYYENTLSDVFVHIKFHIDIQLIIY